MKEVHIAPMTVEGNFHTGKIIEVVAADLYTRWQLFTQSTNNIAVVHDSWNTYGPERSKAAFDHREELITFYKRAKSSLRLLSSADLQVENGMLSSLANQEFRDDDPENVVIVNTALRYLKDQGTLITGIIEGDKGLYLDLDRLLEVHPLLDVLNNTQIFPTRYHSSFRRALDKNNKSSYLGKIPVTKKRMFGLPVAEDLLEGDSFYNDPRFSSAKPVESTQTDEYKICVAPLIILGLLPYIRSQRLSDQREVDFISNGVGSSIRFNLVSILLNKSLGIDQPYRNIHLFGMLDVDEPTDPQVLASKDWAMKIRYVIFDQLSVDHKTVKNTFAHLNQETGKLEVLEFDAFIKRFFHVKHVADCKPKSDFPELTVEEKKYLRDLGVTETMNQLDYAKAFRKLKDELAKRAKQITQGVSSTDSVLLRTINLFFPNL